MVRRLFRKSVQQGRSERRGEAYFLPYVEPLSDARTPLAGFVNSLLESPPMPAPSTPQTILDVTEDLETGGDSGLGRSRDHGIFDQIGASDAV